MADGNRVAANGLVGRERAADDRAAAHRALMSRPSVAFGAFEAITNAWKLSVEQRMALLGVKGRTRYSRWRAELEDVRLEHHHAERIVRVIEIADHLYAVHPNDRTSAERWPTRANSGPDYGGRPPIELMTSGDAEDLYRVCRHLAGWRYR